jgi:glutathione reductase (NADPH)
MGSDVSLLLRKQQFLRSFDAMLRDTLMEEMLNDGVNILPSTQVRAVERREDGSLCLLCNGAVEEIHVDTLIWAIGRTPLTADIGLDEAGVVVGRTEPYQPTHSRTPTCLGYTPSAISPVATR